MARESSSGWLWLGQLPAVRRTIRNARRSQPWCRSFSAARTNLAAARHAPPSSNGTAFVGLIGCDDARQPSASDPVRTMRSSRQDRALAYGMIVQEPVTVNAVLARAWPRQADNVVQCLPGVGSVDRLVAHHHQQRHLDCCCNSLAGLACEVGRIVRNDVRSPHFAGRPMIATSRRCQCGTCGALGQRDPLVLGPCPWQRLDGLWADALASPGQPRKPSARLGHSSGGVRSSRWRLRQRDLRHTTGGSSLGGNASQS